MYGTILGWLQEKERVFLPILGLQEYRNSWESTLIIQKSVSDYAHWIEMAADVAPLPHFVVEISY